jgi:hypothetical protein
MCELRVTLLMCELRVTLHSPTKKFVSLVPWFLGLLLELFGALIQKIVLDGPHLLQFLRYS